MDIDVKTKVADAILHLPDPAHDGATLGEALCDIIGATHPKGRGNACADLRDIIARLREPGAALLSTPYRYPESTAHVAVVRWLVGEVVDLRDIAGIVAGAHRHHPEHIEAALVALDEWAAQD